MLAATKIATNVASSENTVEPADLARCAADRTEESELSMTLLNRKREDARGDEDRHERGQQREHRRACGPGPVCCRSHGGERALDDAVEPKARRCSRRRRSPRTWPAARTPSSLRTWPGVLPIARRRASSR